MSLENKNHTPLPAGPLSTTRLEEDSINRDLVLSSCAGAVHELLILLLMLSLNHQAVCMKRS